MKGKILMSVMIFVLLHRDLPVRTAGAQTRHPPGVAVTVTVTVGTASRGAIAVSLSAATVTVLGPLLVRGSLGKKKIPPARAAGPP